MGLDTSAVVFLCAAKSRGVDFDSTAMIGRQTLWPDPATLRRVFAVLGIDRDAEEFLHLHEYGEAFFSLLGARHIESVDVSPYESATILHDMNVPIPLGLRERFTVVHDGGTIEHVFNIPQAFKNCMEMVRVGGHFTQVTVANNFAGHGFWQLSPELIFRIFSHENGFQLEAVLMHEVTAEGPWYLVSDPDHLHQRVELCNRQPTYILTIAKRIASVPVFKRTPQQSDYVSVWEGRLDRAPQPTPVSKGSRSKAASWRRYIPQSVKRPLRAMLEAMRSSAEDVREDFNPRSYRRIEEDDLLRGRFPAPQAPQPDRSGTG